MSHYPATGDGSAWLGGGGSLPRILSELKINRELFSALLSRRSRSNSTRAIIAASLGSLSARMRASSKGSWPGQERRDALATRRRWIQTSFSNFRRAGPSATPDLPQIGRAHV